MRGEFPVRAAHGDRARVVEGNEDGGPCDVGGHPAKCDGDVPCTGPGWWRCVQVVHEARSAHGAFRGIRDDVHLDSRSAERARGSKSSVVKGIPVDSQEHCGDAGVEQRHRLCFLRSDHPLRRVRDSKAVTAVALLLFL
ncbi:hypothetical protein GCM10010510_33970 [Streptomyces anandii JCM 4720]|nr:hypothetical protein GCM10010510_33970 [Streptomyces anandii JCM 4720]